MTAGEAEARVQAEQCPALSSPVPWEAQPPAVPVQVPVQVPSASQSVCV